jgi:hypothetical protein
MGLELVPYENSLQGLVFWPSIFAIRLDVVWLGLRLAIECLLAIMLPLLHVARCCML